MSKKTLSTGPLGFPDTSEQARQLEQDLITAEKEGLTYTKSVSYSTPDLLQGERADISTISNETVDADKEVVSAKGLDFTAYRKNPAVYWDHDYSQPPVGRCAWVKAQGEQWKAKTIYPSRVEGQQGEFFPDTVWALVSQGVVNGKSIGFVGLEARAPTQQEIDLRPELAKAKRIITKSRVFEYSVCYNPANQDCLVELTSIAKSLACDESTLADLLKLTPDQLQATIKSIEFDEPNEPPAAPVLILPKSARLVTGEVEARLAQLYAQLNTTNTITAEMIVKKLLGRI